jgi:hypothetical protein
MIFQLWNFSSGQTSGQIRVKQNKKIVFVFFFNFIFNLRMKRNSNIKGLV